MNQNTTPSSEVRINACGHNLHIFFGYKIYRLVIFSLINWYSSSVNRNKELINFLR
jgi:hypothetical protein